MRKRFVAWALTVALFAIGVAPGVAAGSLDAVREQVEASMVVTGQLDIETDGSVSRLDLDHEDKLPVGVIELVRDRAMAWKFEPVEREGKVVKARAPMRLRVVAKKLDDGNYRITLRGVNFDRYDSEDPATLRSSRMRPPEYPAEAFQVGAAGNVYLAVKVGRDGRVLDVVPEQINLRFLASEDRLARLRKVFADSATKAARRWTFQVPSEGALADQESWSLRIPINYSLNGQAAEGLDRSYGTWIPYVPGPYTPAPWIERAPAGFSPDTLGDSGVYMADGNAPRLLTPLQGG